MKIEAGKYYRTREGRKAGPMEKSASASYCWSAYVDGDNGRVWRDDGTHGGMYIKRNEEFDLVAEWPNEPTLWHEMTPEQKGALLLAHHEGKPIECILPSNPCDVWDAVDRPGWVGDFAYRVKPEPPQPREFWIGNDKSRVRGSRNCNPIFNSIEAARSAGWLLPDDLIHVREVTE